MIKVKVRSNSETTFAVFSSWQNINERNKIHIPTKEIDIEKFNTPLLQNLIAIGLAMSELNQPAGTVFVTDCKEVCELWVGLKIYDEKLVHKLLQRCGKLARENGYFLFYGE